MDKVEVNLGLTEYAVAVIRNASGKAQKVTKRNGKIREKRPAIRKQRKKPWIVTNAHQRSFKKASVVIGERNQSDSTNVPRMSRSKESKKEGGGKRAQKHIFQPYRPFVSYSSLSVFDSS